MSNVEKSPELAGLYAEISLKDKPELSVLMYQREHLDTQLIRLDDFRSYVFLKAFLEL